MLNLLAWSALAKIGLSFSLILCLQRFKLPLSACIFIGGAAMGLLMGMSPGSVFTAAAKSVLDRQSISLLILVSIIMVLSRLMEDSGQLDRIVASFNNTVGNRKIALIVMPALIGLLPMPGGALFSAPMVDTACGADHVDSAMKTAINYWFRHVWEYWWPLYPGVILAVSLLRIETWQFMLVQLPFTIISLLAGSYFLLRALPETFAQTCDSGVPRAKGGWRTFFREARPIALVVLAIPVVHIFEALSGVSLSSMTPIFIGLGVATLDIIRRNSVPLGRVALALRNRSSVMLLLVIVAIMAFQGILISSHAVDGVKADMSSYGIPPLLIILLMPFLSGLITGVAVGFVGASFPLIVPLIAQHHGLEYLLYGSLAFVFGHMGQMLSPVHICLLVSKDYFSSKLFACYSHTVLLAGTILLTALILLGAFRLLI